MFRLNLIVALTTVSLAFAFPVMAAELPDFASDMQKFKNNEMSAGAVQVWRTIPAQPDKTWQRWAKAFALDSESVSVVSQTDAQTKYDADNWFLIIDASGRSGHFHDRQIAEKAFVQKVPVADSLNDAQVAQLALQSVQGKFLQALPLASDEEIVPAKVRRGVFSVLDDTTKEIVKTVDKYIVSFFRKKAGKYIFGGGSYLQVSLTGDGSLIDVRFDWPEYESAYVEQNFTTQGEILSRSQKISYNASGKMASGKLTRNVTSAKSQLRLIMCGYYDPGSKTKRYDRNIQAACLFNDESAPAGAIQVFAVPAAETPLGDASWQELSLMK